MKKILATIIATVMMAFGLAGCSGASAVAEAESQIVGTYVIAELSVDGAMTPMPENMLVNITFSEDHTVSGVTYTNTNGIVDESSSLSGTWETDRDGNITITKEDGSTYSYKLTETGIEGYNQDGELAGILVPISEEDLNAAIEEVSIDRTRQTVAIGETITTDKYEFTLNSVELSEEIYPPNTSGYYTYYADEAGKQYYVVRGTFKNLSSEYADVKWGTGVVFNINDQYQIQGVAEGYMDDSDDFYYNQPDPLETINVIIWCSVSDEMVSEMTSAQLEWSFTDELNTYYNDSYRSMTYIAALK